jgi:poly-gamma-glutamate capsule biosynthesis protein CapA/YwtB (metallophosphatase superfamily)
VQVAYGGDLILGEDVNWHVAQEGPAAALAEVHELRSADLAVVDLESVVASVGDAVDTGRVEDHFFRGRPEMLAVPEAAGIDAVTIANNHALDYGAEALLEEDRLLTAMGMAHPGAGRTSHDACAPAEFDVGGIRLALIAADATGSGTAADDSRSGTCPLDLANPADPASSLVESITDARERGDVVLVAAQFAATFAPAPTPAERRGAQTLIDLGADAVLGSGAHRLRGIEVYRDRPILYDPSSLLFNFEAPDPSVVYLLSIEPAGVTEIRTVPLVAERAHTRRATPAESVEILATVDGLSAALGTRAVDGVVGLDPVAAGADRARSSGGDRPSARLDPGPAPAPVTDPPPQCVVGEVPADAGLTPTTIGPLTLLGARATPDPVEGDELLWVESYWRTDAPVQGDLWLTSRAERAGSPDWTSDHEPCDWAWPTSRWEPGRIYRDLSPLRPPHELLRLRGVPALLTGQSGGSLAVSLGVQDAKTGRPAGTAVLATTVGLEPGNRPYLALAAGAAVLGGAVLLAIGAVLAWRAGGRRRRRLRSSGSEARWRD